MVCLLHRCCVAERVLKTSAGRTSIQIHYSFEDIDHLVGGRHFGASHA